MSEGHEGKTASRSSSNPSTGRAFRWSGALSAFVATALLATTTGMLLAAQIVDKGRHALFEEWDVSYLASWGLVALVAALPLAVVNGALGGFFRRRSARIALVLVTLLLSFHWLREGSEDAREPVASTSYPSAEEALASSAEVSSERPDLVLVTIDTLRWDHLGYAGYERPTSPHIDALAQRGTIFEHGVAQVPATQGSMASMMTGVYPHVIYHQREQGAAESKGAFVSDSFHTLAERLSAGGYETAAFISNPYLKKSNGFAQGFDHYDERSGLYDPVEAREASAADLVDEAEKWLRTRADERPFFLWVHMLDPHHPYEPLEPGPWENVESERFQTFSEHYTAQSVASMSDHLNRLAAGEEELAPGELDYLIGRYDAEILQADRAVGRLLDALEEHAGGLDHTLVILTADHGEEFLDHGGFLHSHSLYDELVRVPFLVAGPGFAAGDTAAQARLLDIAPTLLRAAGLPTVGVTGTALQDADGDAEPALSFLSLIEVTSRTPTSKYFAGYQTNDFMCPTGQPFRDIFSLFRARYGEGRSKVKMQSRLFDLAEDPGEREPIRNPARLVEEHCTLSSVLSSHPRLEVALGAADAGLSKEDRENLEALGYVTD